MIFTWFAGDFLKTLYFVIEVFNIIYIETTYSIYYVWNSPTNSRYIDHSTNNKL